MRKRLALFLILGSILLEGCDSTPSGNIQLDIATASRQENPFFAPQDESEKRTQPIFEKPTEDRILDPEFWRQNYLPLTHSLQPNYERGEELYGYSVNRHIAGWLAVTKQIDKYWMANGEIIMPLDDFLYYAKRFFGEINAKEEGYEEFIDGKNRTVSLMIPNGYEPKTNTVDLTEYARFMKDMKITEVIPFDQNGAEKIKIEITRYESREEQTDENINRLETYIYFWDDEVGFVVESSSWRWPKTNRVTIEGDAEILPVLWSLQPDDSAEPAAAMERYRKLPAIGEKLYLFYQDNDTVKADIMDWGTLEQETGVTIAGFDDEKIISSAYTGEGLRVFTDVAAYLFDDLFEQKIRKKWPVGLTVGEIHRSVLNDTFEILAFQRADGLYLSAMEESAVPTLIQESTPLERDFSNINSFGYPFPVQFLPDNRIFIGSDAWEGFGGFSIIDYQGKKLEEFPFYTSGFISGGYCALNETEVIFLPQKADFEDHINYFYSFKNNVLESTDWWRIEGFTTAGSPQIIPDPATPGIWYSAVELYPLHHENFSDSERIKTIFVKIDFNQHAVTELPLAVKGARAKLMAASEKGELLFSYAYKAEQGFGIYGRQR